MSAGDRVSGARDEKQFWRRKWRRPPGRTCLPPLTCTLKTVRKARFRVCVFYTTRENNSNNKNVKEIKKKIGSREVGMALKVVGTDSGCSHTIRSQSQTRDVHRVRFTGIHEGPHVFFTTKKPLDRGSTQHPNSDGPSSFYLKHYVSKLSTFRDLRDSSRLQE